MKKFTHTHRALLALALAALTAGIAYFMATAPAAGLVAPGRQSVHNPPPANPSTLQLSNTQVAMTPDQARILIDQTKDKSTIAKEVWLAAGLSELDYKVLWQKGTERPGSSPLDDEKRTGVFVTKGCGIPVFSSEHKFDSGTGWPSFYEVLNADNVVLKDDYSWLGIKRTEVLSTCGEHLGHVFEDGPDPTGLRYCINGAALEFRPMEEGLK